MIAHSEGPRPDLYSGVRADAHYITDSREATNAVSSAIDLPFSFVCDTLFLPVFDIPAAIIKAGHRVAGQSQRPMDDKK